VGIMVRAPGGAGNFSLHHRVQIGSETHSASYLMGARGFSPGDKSGRDVKLSTHLPSNAEFKNA